MSPLERTTDEPTNEERADRIDTVMQAYCLTLEERDFDGDEDDVKDMLTDLMHFCERMEIDFEENLRVARNNYEHERNAERGNSDHIGCPLCGCFLKVARTDPLLGIDRELYDCQECDETFIRELNVPDSALERAVKCVGCGNMIPQSSARIFYQRDDYAHFIGECCWGTIHCATDPTTIIQPAGRHDNPQGGSLSSCLLQRRQTMATKITLNPGYAGGVYVLDHGEFYTCLGYDVVLKKAAALATELNSPEYSPVPTERGTMTAYRKYAALVDKARQNNIATGWRSRVDLTADLIGLEGKRVEVIDCYGDRRRFIVGRSTGWIPCHLEIKSRSSSGGEAVWGTPFRSVRVVGGTA